MARPRNAFVCQNCGATHAQWSGRCDACGEWNTIVEEAASAPVAGAARTAAKARAIAFEGLEGPRDEAPRVATGINELDRVTGGGFVKGSALLVGGDPGIGKSTLLLQACAALARRGSGVAYVSGEESIGQVRLRAARLGLTGAPVLLAAETRVEDIIAGLENAGAQQLVVIDSIQTMWTDTIDSAPGSVGQVRAASQLLIRHAKKTGAAVILVGHVTKDGQIAGPRVVEHMVDAVLYFEGEGGHRFRILRAVKNRFGPTDEIGVFSMSDQGLEGVDNPSALFLGSHERAAPGMAVFAGMEGSRPLLVEIQALVAPSPLGTPRRSVVGWEPNRLAMVLAVLDAHCGLKMAGHDVYLTVAGGLKIAEPAADVAVAAALVSSMARTPLDPQTIHFGEIGLSGAVRPVGFPAARIKEANKLGFCGAVMPSSSIEEANAPAGMKAHGLDSLDQLVARILAAAPKDVTNA
ncbi:MAG: DNA repair protein RadA [Rhodobiaceae bacterium]|nr:DNA repair protein RadA [Rhodobiaceae bacterium]MCC0056519.1 DNA repair protein RadA [Rhodobiaceae bacterium]